MKDKHNIRLLCKCMGIHHSVYYYHKNNKTNKYKENNKEIWITKNKEGTRKQRNDGKPKTSSKKDEQTRNTKHSNEEV